MVMDKTNPQRPLKFLSSAWEARLGLNGRVYYYSLHSQTVQILPPPESWSCAYNLPYGWELALDYSDRPYFINHVLQQVTYEDPRSDRGAGSGGETDSSSTPSDHEPPAPRQYTIGRHHKLGFGFIAGSEKPVIIRSVSPGGPSEGKLLAGDQVIKVGSEYVRNSAREVVIELIRQSLDSVTLTVLQPTRVANSSFLKPSKRLMKGMSRPRVRFADDNGVDGEENLPGSSPLLIVPGTLKVILEEGQSRSFQFSSETTAGDVVAALCEKLGIVDSKLYSLVLTPAKQVEHRGERRNRTSDEILIAPWDCIAKVVANPSVKYHECRFRLTFVSKDIHKLSRDDPRSFRYHFVQCVNDVVAGDVFSDDITLDEALRLASFQMLEVFIGQFADEKSEEGVDSAPPTKKKSFRAPSKISLKQIEREYGLSRFLSPTVLALVNSNQSKEHRKTLQQYLKANFANYVLGNGGGTRTSSPPTSPTSERHLSVDGLLLRIRMQYVKILSPHHLYAGRYFDATILAVIESDITLVVGHHYGISQLVNSKTKMASIFADFTCVTSVEVAPCQPEASKTNVRVEFKEMAPLVLAMHPLSAQTFAFMISGYCRVYDNNDMMLTLPIAESTTELEYFASHKVTPSHWNYPPQEDTGTSPSSSFFYCDFSEPIQSSLLSDQIPVAVRAMYQQSKIVAEEQEQENPVEVEKEKVVSSSPTLHIRPPPRNRLVTDDEGVALSHAELSPFSSGSSVISSSPSSGIGSVTSHPEDTEKAPTDGQAACSNGDGEWNELMVALYNDEEIGLSKDGPVEDKEPPKDTSSSSSESGSESPEELTITNGLPAAQEDQNNEETDEVAPTELTNKTEEEQGAGEEKRDVEVEEPYATIGEPLSAETSPKLNPVAMKRHRFSSFKPDEPENTETETVSNEEPQRASNTLTSDQLKDHLVQSSLNLSEENGEEQNETDDVQIVGSPLPVNDLARGHRSLKNSKKQRNRRSWFGRDSLSRSFSLDTGLSDNQEPKKKSFFRSIFSPSHSYSVKKEKSPSSMSLNRDPMPGSKRSGRWRFFRSPDPTPTPTKKFSFFRFFSRKNRRHTVNISSSDIGSPVSSDAMNSGAYSVFDRETENDKTAELKHATSVEEVQMRPREQVSANPRPVSFMTFQQLPMDFSIKRSPSKHSADSGHESVSPKGTQATFRLPEPKLAIKTVKPRASSEESSGTPAEEKTKPVEEKAVEDGAKARHDYENWGNLTPPAKPVRNRTSSAMETETSDEENVEPKKDETPPVPAARQIYSEVKKPNGPREESIKRKAPPPPKVPPPLIESPITDHDNQSDESDSEADINFERDAIKIEPLDLRHVHSDDDSDQDLERPTPERASNGSEGSLMGEIFAYLKTNNDAVDKSDLEAVQLSVSETPATEQPQEVEAIPRPQVGAEESRSESSDDDEQTTGVQENAESRFVSDSESDQSDDVVIPQTDSEAGGAKGLDTALSDSSDDNNELIDVVNVPEPHMLQDQTSEEPVPLLESPASVNRQNSMGELKEPEEPEPGPEIIYANLTEPDKREFPKDLSIVSDMEDVSPKMEYGRADECPIKDHERLTDNDNVPPDVDLPIDVVPPASSDVSDSEIDDAEPVPSPDDVTQTGPNSPEALQCDIKMAPDLGAIPDSATPPPAAATETVASGNGAIVSTWTFAEPDDLPPPPPAEYLSLVTDKQAQTRASVTDTPNLDFPKTQSVTNSDISTNLHDWKLNSSPSKTAFSYTSLVTPRLFGQRTQMKSYSRVKPPVSIRKPQLSANQANGTGAQPERNGVTAQQTFEPKPTTAKTPRPPVPPKPAHL